MALFGKKKKAEQTAPPVEAQDEIQVVGGDADETDRDDERGAQVIDFDAIADELDNDNGTSTLGQPLSAGTVTAATAPDDFAATSDFGAGSVSLDKDDDPDFGAVFDDGSTAQFAAPQTGENPFGAETMAAMPASGPIDIEPAIAPVSDAPPLTHTAPLLSSDAVATAGMPAVRKSFPLPLMLGALGLLLALGAVGYLVTHTNSTPDETPVVATNPPLRAPKGSASLVNLGAAVDGVPIAPGVSSGIAPALSAPNSTVPPALLKQLKALWKQGAAAKQKGNIAGARAAWTKMLKLRPNHPGVQSAIDKLPAA